jgi:hypothetical protein
MEVATIGLDISKHVFHMHAVDSQGKVAGRQRLRRGEIIPFFSSSHLAWWASRLARLLITGRVKFGSLGTM